MIEAEPALQVVLAGEQIDRALEAIATFVDLKTPFMLGHAQAVAELAARAAAEHGLLSMLRRCGVPGSSTASDGSASRTRSGTSPGRSDRASGSGCGCTRI